MLGQKQSVNLVKRCGMEVALPTLSAHFSIYIFNDV